MATVSAPAPPQQRVVLHTVDWRTYQRLLRALGDRPALRLTYDRGTLEILTTSPEHEHYKQLLGRFIITLTEELDLPIAGYGSMTFTRPRQRGLEPDQCYWIANEARVRARSRIDLRVDPPPDLIVEIDLTSSSLDRMGIYAVLRVPEVWRFADQALTFHLLDPGGQYAPSSHSRSFPLLASADLAPFLGLRGQMDENALMRQFRAWIRRHPGAAGTATVP
jgi:Uma2 family endonuclease